MFSRLRQPRGSIGTLSVVATLTLAILGVLGFASMLLDPAFDTEIWSDADQGDRVLGSVIFALMIVGAVGFLIMDRYPWLGAALAILGSLALAVSLFWTVVPIVIGAVFGFVAVKRARWFHGHAALA